MYQWIRSVDVRQTSWGVVQSAELRNIKDITDERASEGDRYKKMESVKNEDLVMNCETHETH